MCLVKEKSEELQREVIDEGRNGGRLQELKKLNK
jgi:hypothetical protein